MEKASRFSTLTTGFAIFSMFFGAGNVVYPLALGQYAQDHHFYAILGLLVTAVGVPFLGLIAMTLFNGDYKKFFERIGEVPGFIVSIIIMGLIGPFGAIPRCIALSFSTVKLYLSEVSLSTFSILSCLVIFAFVFKPTKILDVLGYFLTPLLLILLTIIIVVGITTSPEAPHTTHAELKIFWNGMKEGYQTMDLLGAFFFSHVVLACLEKEVLPGEKKKYRQMIFLTLKASCIGAFLLSIIYVGFSFVAAFQSESLVGIAKDELAGMIAVKILGPYAGIVTSLAVALACLTTAIALTTVSAEFIHKDISRNHLSYKISLILTLIVTYFVSILDFTGIAKFLLPILQICYPALIVLCILNILYKLYHFKPVKTPVYTMFLITLVAYSMYYWME